ncbi:hypothetical protein, partial [Staphylococcus aureus]
ELQGRLAKRASTASKRGQFVPPQESEVAAFFQGGEVFKNGSALVAAESFMSYFEAQGWRLSNGIKMVDWKAAARRFEHSDKNRRSPAVGRAVEPRL